MTKYRIDRRELLEYLPIVLVLVALTAAIVGATLMVDRAATLIANRLLPEAFRGTADLPGSPTPSVSIVPIPPSHVGGKGQRRAIAGHPARKPAWPGMPIENTPTQLDQ